MQPKPLTVLDSNLPPKVVWDTLGLKPQVGQVKMNDVSAQTTCAAVLLLKSYDSNRTSGNINSQPPQMKKKLAVLCRGQIWPGVNVMCIQQMDERSSKWSLCDESNGNESLEVVGLKFLYWCLKYSIWKADI